MRYGHIGSRHPLPSWTKVLVQKFTEKGVLSLCLINKFQLLHLKRRRVYLWAHYSCNASRHISYACQIMWSYDRTFRSQWHTQVGRCMCFWCNWVIFLFPTVQPSTMTFQIWNHNGSFPLCDSDIAKYRDVLLSVGLFPPSESDVAIAKFWMGSDVTIAIAFTIAQWKRSIRVHSQLAIALVSFDVHWV